MFPLKDCLSSSADFPSKYAASNQVNYSLQALSRSPHHGFSFPSSKSHGLVVRRVACGAREPRLYPRYFKLFLSLLGSKVIERKSELLGSKIVRREFTQMEIKLAITVLPGPIKVIIQNYGLGGKLSMTNNCRRWVWVLEVPTQFSANIFLLPMQKIKNSSAKKSTSPSFSLSLWWRHGFSSSLGLCLSRSIGKVTKFKNLLPKPHLNYCTTDCICVETSEWRTPQLSQSNIKHFQQLWKYLFRAKASCWWSWMLAQ